MELMLASGLLGDAVCVSSCQVGTKYAFIGCPRGSIRKKQEHLALKRLGEQLQAKLELAGTAPHWARCVWGGDCRGQVLRLYPQPVIDPRTLGRDTWQS